MYIYIVYKYVGVDGHHTYCGDVDSVNKLITFNHVQLLEIKILQEVK